MAEDSDAGEETSSVVVMNEAEALRFATETSWDVWVKNKEIRTLLSQIRDATVKLTNDEMASGGATKSILGSTREEIDTSSLKLVVVGDGAVGKTSLLYVYNNGKFPEEYVPTVFENASKNATFKGKSVTLRLYDTAGQEEYDRLRPLSYPGTNIVLLCFSVASRSTFDSISSKWAPEVRHYLPRTPTILVGLKTDVRDEKDDSGKPVDFDPITAEEGASLAKKIGASMYMESSAKKEKGVTEIFEEAMKICWPENGGKAGGDDADDDESTLFPTTVSINATAFAISTATATFITTTTIAPTRWPTSGYCNGKTSTCCCWHNSATSEWPNGAYSSRWRYYSLCYNEPQSTASNP